MRYPTEFEKGRERVKQPLNMDNCRQGIRTYDEEHKLPYMKVNLNLKQPEFTKIGVPESFYSPGMKSKSKSFESFQPLSRAGFGFIIIIGI